MYTGILRRASNLNSPKSVLLGSTFGIVVTITLQNSAI
jgi:hypothetical protein